MGHEPLRVAVLDMQPITPAIGGGRQRLLGLYHALGSGIECTYVGSYDWPGEPARDHRLTACLREITVPLSSAHHAAAAALSARLANRTVIDMAFPIQAKLSPEYLDTARAAINAAHVVVFSHPWCYPPLAKSLSSQQCVVYDSHNVEAVLRTKLFSDVPEAVPILRRAVAAECALCRRADMVLACSHEDASTFNRLYDVAWGKLRTVPNGVFAFGRPQASPAERAAAKSALGVTQGRLVLFLGSGYGPNNDAARFVNERLAPSMPDVGFVLVGGCGKSLDAARVGANVYLPGIVEDDRKHEWLVAADAAINPLAEGSGTCIKMFDYMAASLPIVATPIGARGIAASAEPEYVQTSLSDFAQTLAALLGDTNRRNKLAESARKLVESRYAWERISPNLGLLIGEIANAAQPAPMFTVVVPSYERPLYLEALLNHLDAQSLHDFEVVVVDQSASAWSSAGSPHAFPLRYVHTPVKGAVPGRNLGAFLARGKIIAFTDDDCLPSPDWLANALRWFADPSVIGLEGFIRSDHPNDENWRPVTNAGCIGLGFMTANLLVRNAAFQQLDGFDPAFDNPHFREDTDFGWRLQQLGKVPFATDVEVFHPAQRRSIQRESAETRGRFFMKDALLLKKFPVRYAELFRQEGHYLGTEGYWTNLQRGLALYGVSMPDWMRPYAAKADTRTGAISNHKTSNAD